MPGRIALVVSVISCAALLTSAGFAIADVGPNWAAFVAACGLLGVVASWVLAYVVARHHVRVLDRIAKLLNCESDELSAILPLIKRMGVPLVAFTGRPDSTLARHADVVLDTAVAREACPHNLAPTASTTAQLALGDALAVALLNARGFKADDFARSHPGGSLGRKLLTHVSDVMRSGDDVPRVTLDVPLMGLMREMSAKGLGMSAVVDGAGQVLGIFTDGDLRRVIERTGNSTDLRALSAGDVMHPNPRTVRADALAVEAADLMEASRITSVLVVDDTGALVGALNSNDLMRAKVI